MGDRRGEDRRTRVTRRWHTDAMMCPMPQLRQSVLPSPAQERDLRDGVGRPALADRPEPVAAEASPSRCPRLDSKALLVCSSGGHLAQLRVLADLWEPDHRVWVTFDTSDAVSLLDREEVVWAHHPTTRNIPNLVRNTVLALRLLHRRRPDLVVSTGAAVAFPFFVLARLRRIPTVYIEVYDRLDTPTLTGRLCRPLTSLFLVQWAEQLAFYPRAIVVGPLL